jgi:azurin
MMRRSMAVLLGGLVLTFGCGGKSLSEELKERNDKEQTLMEAEQVAKAKEELAIQKEVEEKNKAKLAQAATAAAAEADVTVYKVSSVANTMTFDVTALKATAGERVKIIFHNSSTDKLLPHNWVLVRPGTEAAVALAGLGQGAEKGFLAPGKDVLAATPLAARGETVEVTFTAPAAGTYPFICTVPGHYMMMKGMLVVSP